MKWSDLLEMLNDEVLTSEAWPDESMREEKAIERLHSATVIVARYRKINDLPLEDQSITIEETDKYNKGPLPETIFADRRDLGISGVHLNGIFQNFLSMAASIDVIIEAQRNMFQKNEPYFHVDVDNRRIYVTDVVTDLSIRHSPYPARPYYGDIWELDYPYRTTIAEEAVQLAAAHIKGSKLNRGGQMSMHMTYAKLYGTPTT